MNRFHRRIVAVAFLMAGSLAGAGNAQAQSAPVLLLLDSNAVAAEQAPNLFSPEDVNASIAGVGVREPLRFFAQKTDETIVLPGGVAGHEGWFTLGSTPAGWASDPSVDDGSKNFLSAGPGLGSPDEAGNRTSLLTSVGVTPLSLAQLQFLAGRDVCAAVFANELTWSADGTALDGPTTGVVSFSVVSVVEGSEGVVEVTVRIKPYAATCGGVVETAQF